ncbi:hypothetical protein OAL43_03270 [bacterium]|nr:hypothetical protein [bacterium]
MPEQIDLASLLIVKYWIVGRVNDCHMLTTFVSLEFSCPFVSFNLSPTWSLGTAFFSHSLPLKTSLVTPENMMKSQLRIIAHSFTVAAVSMLIVGCGGSDVDSTATSTVSATADHDDDHGDHDHGDHDHGDHDHEDHAEVHEHPAHGLNGGHMVKLEDGSEIEVALNKENDSFAVFPANPSEVTEILMTSKVDETVTNFEFAASEDSATEGAFVLTSPELATAVRMGDPVEVRLILKTNDGETSVKYEHHEH